MSNPTLPGTSGLISDPTARIVIGSIFGWASLALSASLIVDSAIPSVDYSIITAPAATILIGLFGLFQLTSTSPNVPTPKRLASAPVIGVDTGIPTIPSAGE